MMFSIQALGAGVSNTALTDAGSLADRLLSGTSNAFGFVDINTLAAGLSELASSDPTLAKMVEAALVERLPVTDQAALTKSKGEVAEGGTDTKPSIREGLHLSRDEYLAQAKDLWNSVAPPIVEIKQQGESKRVFSSNADVRQAAKEVASAPMSSTADVVADPAVRDFVRDISVATARAKIGGRDQQFEKFFVIGQDTLGEPFVKTIGVLGENGGRIPSQAGDVVAHRHYDSLVQPPNGADESAARIGRSSFVINDDGRTVWEIGRINGEVKVRTVGDDGATGKWRDFEAQLK